MHLESKVHFTFKMFKKNGKKLHGENTNILFFDIDILCHKMHFVEKDHVNINFRASKFIFLHMP
jgi:prepilin-type processing-associated H-X9-DG protein